MSRQRIDNMIEKIRGMSSHELLVEIASRAAQSEALGGWWSGDNELGAVQAIQLNPVSVLIQSPDSVTGQSTLIAALKGGRSTGFKMGETGFPQQWTLALTPMYDLQIDGGVAVETIWEILAEVTFGTGGASRSCIINVQNGTTIMGVANAIEVRCFYDPLYLGEGNPQNQRVSLTLGRGATQNPRAERIIEVAVGATSTGALTIIPPFSRRVSLTPVNAASAPLLFSSTNLLEFRGSGNTVGAVALAGLNPSIEFPIPSAARQVRVINATGSVLTYKYHFHIGF